MARTTAVVTSQRSRIQPTSEAWEASVLPLNEARSLFLIVVVNLPVSSGVRLIDVVLDRFGIEERKSVGLERLPVTTSPVRPVSLANFVEPT
jgi:hypothetical protein